MAFTYRFKDIYDNIIYVGYTGQQMSERMNQHFTKGHLPKDCYSSVAKIEYIKWKTKSDAQVMETYFINKYKPKYNKQNKRNDALTITLDEKEWKTYQVLKKQAEKSEASWGCLTWVLITSLVYAIYQLLF